MKKNVIWVLPWFGVAAAVQSTNGADFSSQTFDYVVVGGGTAGLTVAARLSEDPKVSVGVIEAGPYFENDPLVDTPGLAGQLPGNPKYDWMFSSVPQRHVNNRVLPMPRGKALGGSSAINLMALDRASKTEYDSWEDLGNPKWNWNEFLPYMKAAERFTGIDPFRANATGAGPDDIFPSQGTDGTIAASFNTWYSDIVVPFREAMANRGVPINFDPDSGDPFGLYNSATAVNRTTGTRSYAASTYFAYNSGRANFVVLTGGQATKIEFKSPTTGKYERLDREVADEEISALQKAQYQIQKDWLKKRVGDLEVVLTTGYGGTGTPKVNTSYVSIQMAVQHPFSRGSVHINSTDPLVAPQIDPNYFSKSIVITSVAVVAADVVRRGISTDGANFASKAYDYIVIGGGTAGTALAARLAEDPQKTVGVIEAGEYLPDDPLINTPASSFSLLGNPQYDWLFSSVPQVNANNQAIPLPRGKVLGGSSAINSMVFDRGSKVEYDAWAKLGNKGWDWEGFLPSMKAAERFTGADPFRVNYTGADPNDIFPSQGRNGLIAAGYNNWYSDLVLPVGKSMSSLGVPVNFDPDSGHAYGIFNTATSVNRTTGLPTKINFKDNTGGKLGDLVATGVSFVHKSQTYTVRANKEIILSAGTFQSPHLLELSGIGNSTILEKNGIKTLIDLPAVGENYQDHMLVASTYELKPGSSILNYDALRNNATFAASAAAQYNATRDGVLASTASILSFINLDLLGSPAEIKNITARLDREIASEKITPLQKASYDIQKGWLKEEVGLVEIIPFPGYAGAGIPKANTTYLTLIAVVEHPFSRGNIHLNSSDPLVPPRIDPKYFSKSFDLDLLVHSVKFMEKIAKTEPLASMIISRQEPTPEVVSETALANYIKANVASIHHPIGSVSLAPKELGGVVDARLKVYGTANLRVVDASIIPLHIGSHLQRTVYGIAEKAAQIIKTAY
ncbi:Pyranose dehydrogenase 1 [Rhizoctonia solani]|uniref:Pyranose dehydrogenase 1 n=1 Tax=Rhizoctonia solani TaxID=456999 RepID=A0A0K6FSW4_9AGAM|nr:Pyranose dehydrogenase 1 [Rhizoctonia solani]